MTKRIELPNGMYGRLDPDGLWTICNKDGSAFYGAIDDRAMTAVDVFAGAMQAPPMPTSSAEKLSDIPRDLWQGHPLPGDYAIVADRTISKYEANAKGEKNYRRLLGIWCGTNDEAKEFAKAMEATQPPAADGKSKTVMEIFEADAVASNAALPDGWYTKITEDSVLPFTVRDGIKKQGIPAEIHKKSQSFEAQRLREALEIAATQMALFRWGYAFDLVTAALTQPASGGGE